MMGYLNAFAAVIALGGNVVCQVCTARYVAGLSLLKSLYVGFILGIFSLMFIELYWLKQAHLSLTGNMFSILANVITYSALGYCYFHFVNLGETARRIRILRELYDSKDGLSMDGILFVYNAEEMIGKRIDRLISSGQIICRDNRHYINIPIMLLTAKVIVTMKLILLGKKSEFD